MEILLWENDFIFGCVVVFFVCNDELNCVVNVELEKGLIMLMQLQNMMLSVLFILLVDIEGYYLCVLEVLENEDSWVFDFKMWFWFIKQVEVSIFSYYISLYMDYFIYYLMIIIFKFIIILEGKFKGSLVFYFDFIFMGFVLCQMVVFVQGEFFVV